MINKFTLSRVQEIRFVKEHLDEFIANNISLSRYEDDDPLKDIAERNFYATYDYILSHPEVENDYKCLLDLHTMLMKDLDNGIKSELNERQIAELSEMINQPTKANLEIAIDVFLYILDKRLFTPKPIWRSPSTYSFTSWTNVCSPTVMSVPPWPSPIRSWSIMAVVFSPYR